jgi:endogenous inhibitor of DNA gyrase (YacG/DUF329 family)
MRCPICKKTFEPQIAKDSIASPFCSERCRTIDLGRWLGETYSMPVDPEAEEFETSDDIERRSDGAARDAGE